MTNIAIAIEGRGREGDGDPERYRHVTGATAVLHVCSLSGSFFISRYNSNYEHETNIENGDDYG